MLKKALLGLLLCLFFIVLRAPASVWDGALRQASQGSFGLLETEGSVWQGKAMLGLLDPEAGQLRAVMPVAWQWHPSLLLRGHVAWDFSLAGSPPFTLDTALQGFSIRTLRISLPARFAMERIPNTLGRAGWHGDWLINVPAWTCNWQRVCEGNLSARWEGAASDLFPTRQLGNYRLDIQARDGNLDLQIATEGGDVRISATGQLDANRNYRLNGTITGDPAFVGRIPNVASQYVQRTATPGLLNFGVQGKAR